MVGERGGGEEGSQVGSSFYSDNYSSSTMARYQTCPVNFKNKYFFKWTGLFYPVAVAKHYEVIKYVIIICWYSADDEG